MAFINIWFDLSTILITWKLIKTISSKSSFAAIPLIILDILLACALISILHGTLQVANQMIQIWGGFSLPELHIYFNKYQWSIFTKGIFSTYDGIMDAMLVLFKNKEYIDSHHPDFPLE